MRRRQTTIRRRSLIEQMEVRIALAADMHNFLEPGDVNGDGDVRPSDALTVINLLARSDSDSRSPEGESVDHAVRGMFPDVNEDGSISALDALRVINELGQDASVDGSASAKETLEGESGLRARVSLEIKDGDRAEVEIRVAGASPNTSLDVSVDGVLLGQVAVNDQGRGKLELKYSPNTAEIPQVLRDATVDSTITIGDSLVGTFGTLGELEFGDGASDGASDGESDALSDALSDGASDGDPDAVSDTQSNATSDGSSDGDADSSATSLGSGSSLASGESEDSADGDADDESDALSDAESDGSIDAESDGASDAGSDGASDGDADGESRRRSD